MDSGCVRRPSPDPAMTSLLHPLYPTTFSYHFILVSLPTIPSPNPYTLELTTFIRSFDQITTHLDLLGINKRHLCSVTARERNILDSIKSGSTKAFGHMFSGLGEIPENMI